MKKILLLIAFLATSLTYSQKKDFTISGIIKSAEDKEMLEQRVSFLNYLSSEACLWIKDLDYCCAKLDKLYLKACEAYKKINGEINHLKPEELFINGKSLKQVLDKMVKSPTAQEARVQVCLPDGKYYDITSLQLLENKLLGVRESHRLVFTIKAETWNMGKVLKKID